MDRTVITTLNDTLGWFDRDAAESWDEDTYWDGNNTISRATGSQWEHETLYRTRSGRWVLETTSAYQDSWSEITPERAAKWLLRNDHDDPRVAREIAELEV